MCLACNERIFKNHSVERPLVCVFFLAFDRQKGRWVVRAKHNCCIGFSTKNRAITKVKGSGNSFITPQDIIGAAHEECMPCVMSSFDIFGGNINRSDARAVACRALGSNLHKLQIA